MPKARKYNAKIITSFYAESGLICLGPKARNFFALLFYKNVNASNTAYAYDEVVIVAANRVATEIAVSVTKDGRVQPYVARGGTSEYVSSYGVLI